MKPRPPLRLHDVPAWVPIGRWDIVCSAFLIALIVAYYMAILTVAIHLMRYAAQLTTRLWPSLYASALHGALLVLIVALLWHLLNHFVYGVTALVTPVVEDREPPHPGIGLDPLRHRPDARAERPLDESLDRRLDAAGLAHSNTGEAVRGSGDRSSPECGRGPRASLGAHPLAPWGAALQ